MQLSCLAKEKSCWPMRRGLLPDYNTLAGRAQRSWLWTGCCAETGALSNQTSWRGWCLEIKSDCLFSNASRSAWGGPVPSGGRLEEAAGAGGSWIPEQFNCELGPATDLWLQSTGWRCLQSFSSFSRLSWGKSQDLAGTNLALLLPSPPNLFFTQIWH